MEVTTCFFASLLLYDGFPRLPGLSVTFAACMKRNCLLGQVCKGLFWLRQLRS